MKETDQKMAKKHKFREAMSKKERATDFVDQICMEHGGPVTSADEVKELAQKNSPNLTRV